MKEVDTQSVLLGGAGDNPANRFETLAVNLEPEEKDEGLFSGHPFFKDRSQSILSHNDSPDVGFTSV
jgi:hypothetical protein